MEPEDELDRPQEETSLTDEPQMEAEGEESDNASDGPVHSRPVEPEAGLISEEESAPAPAAKATARSVADGDGGGGREPDELNLGTANVESIMDIEIPITVTFGSTSRPLREILRFAPGSRVELNHRAKQPVVIKVNNKPFARGQVVVVDGCYGVKIEEIEPAARRIASLGE